MSKVLPFQNINLSSSSYTREIIWNNYRFRPAQTPWPRQIACTHQAAYNGAHESLHRSAMGRAQRRQSVRWGKDKGWYLCSPDGAIEVFVSRWRWLARLIWATFQRRQAAGLIGWPGTWGDIGEWNIEFRIYLHK